MSDIGRIMTKLDDLSEDIHDVKTQGALTALAVENLNAELQEHKHFDIRVAVRKSNKITRNIAISVAVCAAISCWIAYKGLTNKPQSTKQPVAITKEIGSDNFGKHNRRHSNLD